MTARFARFSESLTHSRRSVFYAGSRRFLLLHGKEFVAMCDYSLQSVRSRAAKTGDNLVTKDFRTGTRGFASAEDLTTAVCVLPGTELVFAREVKPIRPR